MSHHWSAAGAYSKKQSSAWVWRDFENILKVRLQPSARLKMEKRFDFALRERMLERCRWMMIGEKKGRTSYVERAYEYVSTTPEEEDAPPPSKLGQFALDQGLKPVKTDPGSYGPTLTWGTIDGLPEWVRQAPWLADYVATFRTSSEVPLDYLVCCGLSAIAVSLTNNLRIEHWGILFTPNIYSLLIGDAGETHKSTAISHARRLVKAAHSEWWTLDGFSQQSLEQSLAKQPWGLVVQDEFHTLLTGGGGSYKSDVRDFLRTLHNCISYHTTYVSRGAVEINYPSVTMIGGITPEQFWEASDKGVFMGGLFSRLIPCWDTYMGKPVMSVTYEGLETAKARMVEWLRYIEMTSETIVTLSPTDSERLQAWDKELREVYNDPTKRFWGANIAARAVVTALRLATLLWACRRRPTPRTHIPSECLDYAMNYTSRLLAVAHEAIDANYAANPDDRVLQNVIGFVADQGGASTFDALLRHLRVMRNVAWKAVNTLEEAKILAVDKREDDVEGKTTKLTLRRPEEEERIKRAIRKDKEV